jgi:hypothetical protein
VCSAIIIISRQRVNTTNGRAGFCHFLVANTDFVIANVFLFVWFGSHLPNEVFDVTINRDQRSIAEKDFRLEHGKCR